MMNILSVFNKKKFRLDEIIMIIKKTIVLFNANLSLPEIISYLKKDYPNKLIEEIEKDILRGERLSQAIKTNYKADPFIMGIIMVGEQTGEFIKSLNIILNYLENKKKIKNKILSASIYPLILLGTIITLLLFIDNYLLPVLLEMYSLYGIEISFGMQVFMNVEKLFKYLFFIISILVLLIYSIKRFNFYKLDYIIDKKLIRIPIYRRIYFYYFFSNVYFFLTAGFTMSESLEKILKIVENRYIIKCINSINNYIKNGNRFSKSLEAEGFINENIIGIIRIGERTGNIDTSIENIVLLLKEEIYYEIEKKSKLIEPILIIVMGLIITMIVVFIIMPLGNVDFYLN